MSICTIVVGTVEHIFNSKYERIHISRKIKTEQFESTKRLNKNPFKNAAIAHNKDNAWIKTYAQGTFNRDLFRAFIALEWFWMGLIGLNIILLLNATRDAIIKMTKNPQANQFVGGSLQFWWNCWKNPIFEYEFKLIRLGESNEVLKSLKIYKKKTDKALPLTFAINYKVNSSRKSVWTFSLWSEFGWRNKV